MEGDGVSSRHARIFGNVANLHVEPIANAPLTVNGKPAYASTPVGDGDWLAIGSVFLHIRITDDAVAKSDVSHPEPLSPPACREPRQFITVGRLPGCDLEIPCPMVSRRHAGLLHENGVTELFDFDSTNGTFLNGRRIAGHVRLERGDKVQIAAYSFAFTGDALEPAGSKGFIRLEAHKLAKQVRDRANGQTRFLLKDIDLIVEPGEFVGIFGTSGSGKSTLLDALNGRRPATTGWVLYNGIDFYTAFDIFRSVIGYVPQQDIVHRKISLRNALRYTARLRLPPDTSSDEIDFHISRVLKQVGLSDKALSPIDTPSPLSGGQMKRVNLAVELIANPNILFVDEVTSGLDAGTDKKIMQLLAELAAQQKTIICITHSLENIDGCDLILLLHHGKMIYYGPPQDAPGYFGICRLSHVYELIENNTRDYWAEKFRESSHYADYIKNRSSVSETGHNSLRNRQVHVPSNRRSGSYLSQSVTLLRRYTNLLLADRRNLAILLLQAPLVGVLVGIVFDISGSPQARAVSESQVSFILVLSAIWCGCLNSTREVVKELPIYLRERAVNLAIGPYLASKLIPLSVMCMVQCLALLGIVTSLISWSGDFITRLSALFLAAMAATCMGLSVSTLVDSNDKAVALVPILLIPQVILSNFIVHLGRVGAAIAQVAIIAFSSFDAMKTTLSRDLASLAPTEGTLHTNLAATACLAVAFVVAALVGLKVKDIKGR
ncbi:MAG TPA: ATP-binding cassette domain-containing protein [Syntrophobacteraceae bacterium]|nr:ATP-binding cassette domain-containing protein [Syntrophobacteraceae bacterium]